MTEWLVQRRPTGITGDNGAWFDEGVVEAETAAEAVRLVAEVDSHRYCTYRAAPLPAWEKFDVNEVTTYERTVTVKPHDGPTVADQCEVMHFERIRGLIAAVRGG